MTFDINVETTYKLTKTDIEDLIVTALCGGVGYWACLDNSRPEYDKQPKHESVDTWTAKILLNGGKVYFLDEEDRSTVWELTLEKLLDGIKKYIEGGHDRYGAFHGNGIDMGNIDAECADMIFQLALFGEVVYG